MSEMSSKVSKNLYIKIASNIAELLKANRQEFGFKNALKCFVEYLIKRLGNRQKKDN